MTPEQTINLGGALGGALAGLAIWAAVMRGAEPHRRRWRLLSIIPVALMPLVASAMIWSTVIGLDQHKPVLDRVFQDAGNMGIAAFALGLILYIFRQQERALYGVSEVAFGIATAAWVGWQAPEGTLARLLAMAGAVYIVVRGLDNLNTARKAAEGTPFLRWLADRQSRNSPGPSASEADKPKADQSSKGAGAKGS